MFKFVDHKFITARIRKMREGNIFSLFTLGGGGNSISALDRGYPIPGLGEQGGLYPIPGLDRGGTLSQVWMGRGYPIPGLDGEGVPHCTSGWGVPHPRSGQGGTPSQVWMGVPHPRSGRGLPHFADWGTQGTPLSRPGTEGTRGTPLVSKASTCYATGGVPLAFTQEDFLFCVIVFIRLHKNTCQIIKDTF